MVTVSAPKSRVTHSSRTLIGLTQVGGSEPAWNFACAFEVMDYTKDLLTLTVEKGSSSGVSFLSRGASTPGGERAGQSKSNKRHPSIA